MAEEREPPPLHDAPQSDFTELEDGEDLFVSTVSVIEVRRYYHNDSLSAVSLYADGDFTRRAARHVSARISVYTQSHVIYVFCFYTETFH